MEKPPSPEFLAAQLRKPSGDFATVIGDKMNEVNEFLYDVLIETMNIKPGDSILEIGFGNGKFFDKLVAITNQLKVKGIDYSDEMVAAAIRHNQDKIKEGRLILKAGTSDNIPFESNSFNKVFSSMVIYFWDKPEDHLREIHRVVKPGGQLFTGIRSKDSMKQFPFIDYGFKLYEYDEWISILEMNKFKVSATVTRNQKFETDNGDIDLESTCIIAYKIE